MQRMTIIAVFLFTLLTGNSTITNAASHTYADVPETHNNYAEVTYLLERGIIPKSTTYGINDIMTREDVAVFIAKALQLDGTQRSTKFSDVPQSHPNSGYIQSAVEAGIINGYDDGTFKPKAKITRGHMATFIARAFPLPSGTQTFTDVPKGHTAYEAVQQLAAAGITTGFDDGTFKPAQNLSRAHISAFLTRALVYADVHSFNVDAFLQTVYANDNLHEQLTLLNEQQSQANSLLTKENNALNALLTQKKELEATITTTQEQLKPLQAQIEDYHATISAANAEIVQYRANNKHLISGTTKQKELYLQTLETMQTAYAQLQKEKEAALAKRDKLHKQYTKEQASLNQRRTAIQMKQQAVTKQKETIASLKTATTTVSTKIAAIEQQKQREEQQRILEEQQAQAQKAREEQQKQWEQALKEREQNQKEQLTDKEQTANKTQTTPVEKENEPLTSYKEQDSNTTTEHYNYTNDTSNVSTPTVEPYVIDQDYLTDDERELARLVNEYRVSLGLEPLTISRSLTIVARTHVVDSNLYHPASGTDERGVACNLHSWSDNSNWTPVCYTGDHEYAELMWNKPSELTEYTGYGYEISVGSALAKLSPTIALKAWQNSHLHNNVIIGDGYWSSLTTMGIGIHGGYSHIWFGVESDPAAMIE